MTSPIETPARHLAKQGPGKIADIQAIVDRARELLEQEDWNTIKSGTPAEVEGFPWESTKVDPNAVKRPLMAAVEEQATGEGLTAYFYSAPCRDENDMRKQLSHHIGRHLANAARISSFTDPLPSAAFFLSPNMAKALQGLDDRDEGPGAVSFFARYYANYS